ncbi:MAG: glycine zipper 2TM domain-containing protein [Ramlibacter sp.]
MSAALSSEASSTAGAPSSLRAVPKAVWAVLAALGIATAGLAGALVMHSADKQSAAPAAQASALPQVAPNDAPAAVAQLQPAAQPGAQPAQPPAQVAQHAPAHAAKPAPHRAPAQPAPGQVAQAPQWSAPMETTRAAICASCGTVESVQAVQEKGEGSGLGVAGGAIAGGLLGHQAGGGKGKTALTVLGAVGGALAGNEVEKRVRATTVYDVQVRMEDGSVRTFRRNEPMTAGTRVQVEGNSLRVSSGGTVNEPRVLRTSTGA